MLYLLRLLRLQKVLSLLDEKKFQGFIKIFFERSLKTAIQKNPVMKPMAVDHNKIMQQIYIMYIFKVVRLVLFTSILSYFIGTFWFLLVKHNTDEAGEDFTFYNSYGIGDNTDTENLIIVVYFAFTTLSTVGFGDFNPKSEVERIVTTLILLVGVATFSYIMGQFIDILLQLEHVTADNEESE